MDYRERFKNLRIDNDLTQADIGNICNVTYQAVAHWEAKRRDMPIDCVIKLCEFYNVSSDSILGVKLRS
ncbi:MAG: helix-turn-helix domain-containing protein [Defluviitaleaceae bacterium]|nr:helix-turn-helix domain-containing protein [Defluviitaleaceae bacterium]